MPNWDEIQREWETTKITLAALAEKHDVKLGTLKSRKSRDAKDGNPWTRGAPTKDATIQKDATLKNEEVATNKKATKDSVEKNPSSIGNQKGQRRRSGNPNPKNQFSHRNNPKLIHGLRSKFLHAEQIEIMEALEGTSFIDQLWMQIEIKFSAIIRMQKIMWVEDEHDHLDKLSSESDSLEGDSQSYKVIYAHERYEAYIKAQARAMAEYRNLVKQYIELTDEFDERRLKLEGMQAGIDKTKADTDFALQRADKIRGTKKDTGLLDALVAGREEYMQMKEREKDE